MYRITPLAQHARCLLYCRTPFGHHVVSFKSSTPSLKYEKAAMHREPCLPPPIPPPRPPKDDRLLWATIAFALIAGTFTVYAKHNPELRDWITIYAPWYDDFIAIVHEENHTYKEYLNIKLEELGKYFLDENTGTQPCIEVDGKLVPPLVVTEQPTQEIVKGSDGEPCDIFKAPVISKDICELERCLKDIGDCAINNYITAREACVCYNKLVYTTMLDFSLSEARYLAEAMEERQELVKCSLGKVKENVSKLDELTRYLDCGMQATNEAKDITKMLIQEYNDKIKTANIEYQWENDKALAYDLHWQKVQSLVEKFIEENQSMFQGLKYDDRRLHFTGDSDLLLYHTYRYIMKLKSELKDAVIGMSERVNRGVEMLSHGEKENQARNALIEASIKKKKADMEKEYAKRLEDQKTNNDKALKDALQNQLIRHNHSMEIKVADKERETMKKLNKLVAETVKMEKHLMKHQLDEMTQKLKVVEERLNAHLKAERESRRSQDLWIAGASLLAATKRGDSHVKVDKEIKAIEKAAEDGDTLVETVLKAIPKSVREDGVVPESILRERYHKMEGIALKVALVEQDGAPLPIYFLSWLQSALLFMKLSGIPQTEFEKAPKEIKGLDTFDLLQRARFYIERGNIAAALRYVSSLEGASRAAAAAWRDAARDHLETRQAADAVLAHAAALGLHYV